MRARLLWAGLWALTFVAADVFGTALHAGDRFDPKGASVVLVAIVEGLGFSALFVLFSAALCVLARIRPGPLAPRFGRAVALGLALLAVLLHLTVVRRVERDIPAAEIEIAQRGTQKNVLWIVIDTLRADLLYGDDLSFPHAPAIAALAREGIVFTQADAPSSWTIPSTAALLSGVNPLALDANAGYLTPSAHTAAEILSSAGYETRAVVDNSLVDRDNGFAQGFDGYEKRTGLEFAWRLLAWYCVPARLADRLRFALAVTYSGAERVSERARAIIDEERRGPLFLYVHYMDTHHPYFDHPEFGEAPLDAEAFDVEDKAWRSEIRQGKTHLTGGQERMLLHLYGNELRYVDQHLGRLLADVDGRFGKGETLVVLTADHGEAFFEHGELGHGISLYDEIVRIPLVLRLPGTSGATARIVGQPVSLVDVLPTTLDVLGVAMGEAESALPIEGRSLLALLGPGLGASDVPLFACQDRFHRRIQRWRRGDLVLIESRQRGAAQRRELYDLGLDPAQQHDLAAQDPDRAALLAAELAHFLEAQESLRAKTEQLGDVDASALKALGYGGN